jgi:hypothetical protein
VCSTKTKEMQTKFKCSKCNMGLCADPCFRVYHTKLHFWRLSGTMLGKVKSKTKYCNYTIILLIIF